jgi:hypothetical protein
VFEAGVLGFIHLKHRVVVGEKAALDVVRVLCNGLQREVTIVLVALDEFQMEGGEP